MVSIGKYASFHPRAEIIEVVEKNLNQIFSSTKVFNKYTQFLGSRDGFDLPEAGTSIILLALKAYQVLKDEQYKTAAQKLLSKYSNLNVHTNFRQHNGLSNLGELFIEAWQVLPKKKKV